MIIPFAEPTAPRYIYINPNNNRVHLLVPIVGGQEISTDNTCKSTAALDLFFQQGAALRELNAYKEALQFDLKWLENDHPLKAPKQARLTQINAYIDALPAMQTRYQTALTSLMQTRSNLYSIQLRPREQDMASRVINPVFSINRSNDATGTPKSALYNALHSAFSIATIAVIDPLAQLSQAVIDALPEQPVNFKVIQGVLTEQSQRLLGLNINFTESSDGTLVVQASVDALMGFTADNPATTHDYIDALLGVCAPNLLENIPTPPFYSIRHDTDKAEKLSILTQFFLAHINIYCVANGISVNNFGAVLDKSPVLSAAVANRVTRALSTGTDVENNLGAFFNEHRLEFGLNNPLTPADIGLITQKFERTYNTVTATKENPHMDDFMILDATSVTGKFVTHQGSICTDFSELVSPSPPLINWLYSFIPWIFALNVRTPNTAFQTIRSDVENQQDRVISPNNAHIQASIDLSIEALISTLKDDDQFDKLPIKIKLACMTLPEFKLRRFLYDVAKGR